jgi:hypothetical protein
VSLEADGGGTILIDPVSLRRAGSRLKSVASELQTASHSIAGDGLPTMPANVAALVQQVLAELVDTVGTVPPGLEATVVELTRRAFWAEYADRIMGGYPLSGPAKQEFENYLRDGTLLKYLDPVEAAAAGKELALVAGDFRKDQTQLFLVAAALQGAERSGSPNLKDFCAGFVMQFGPKNMLQVPRVIQAMEWSRAITFTNDPMQDPHLLKDVARTWTDTKLQTDPLKDLLAPFGIALANATMSGRLTQQQEDDIADSDDQWSVAALVSQGNKFDTHFLTECFNKGVAQKIADDSRYYSMRNISGEPPAVDPYSLGRMYSEGNGGLPVDTKQIILDALARNPEAAAAALKPGSLDNLQVFDRFGNETPVSDPVTLIYQYGHFDDHGAAFGHAFVAGEQSAHTADPTTAGNMTLRLIDQVVNHGRDDMTPVQVSLAHTIADHYVGDLHVAANSGSSVSNLDPDQDGIPGEANAYGIQLSRPQVTHLLSSLLGDGGSRHELMNGVVAYQTDTIRAGFAGHGPQNWAHQLGSFDGVLNSASAGNNVQSVEDAQARQAAIANALDSVTSLVPLPHGLDVVAGQVPDLIASHYGPHGPSATDRNAVFHDQLADQLNASITSGYVAAHPEVAAAVPHDVTAMGHMPGFTPTSFVDGAGHVIPWNAMTDDQQRTFENWYLTHEHYGGTERDQAMAALGQHSEDQTGN